MVGINSQKLSANGYEGIGFAIPIDEALPILKDLMSYGRVTGRVKLGISAYAVNEYVASVNGIPSGILIDSIVPIPLCWLPAYRRAISSPR